MGGHRDSNFPSWQVSAAPGHLLVAAWSSFHLIVQPRSLAHVPTRSKWLFGLASALDPAAVRREVGLHFCLGVNLLPSHYSLGGWLFVTILLGVGRFRSPAELPIVDGWISSTINLLDYLGVSLWVTGL